MYNKMYSVKINNKILYFRTNDFKYLAEYLNWHYYDFEIRYIKLLKRIYRKTDSFIVV